MTGVFKHSRPDMTAAGMDVLSTICIYESKKKR